MMSKMKKITCLRFCFINWSEQTIVLSSRLLVFIKNEPTFFYCY